jgi:hypothetical protein
VERLKVKTLSWSPSTAKRKKEIYERTLGTPTLSQEIPAEGVPKDIANMSLTQTLQCAPWPQPHQTPALSFWTIGTATAPAPGYGRCLLGEVHIGEVLKSSHDSFLIQSHTGVSDCQKLGNYLNSSCKGGWETALLPLIFSGCQVDSVLHILKLSRYRFRHTSFCWLCFVE